MLHLCCLLVSVGRHRREVMARAGIYTANSLEQQAADSPPIPWLTVHRCLIRCTVPAAIVTQLRHDNLLVLLLRLPSYKLVRDRSRRILPRARQANSKAPARTEVHPRGHDLFWVLRAALAADRGRSTHHGQHAAPHMRCIQGFP